LAGVAVIAFFVGVGVLWGGSAPIAGAAIAPGVVSPDGRRRTVQHLEGGIIHQILVSAGDRVSVGQPLIVLEETQALADYRRILVQRRTYAAMQARLEAEQASAPEVTFPDWLAADSGEVEVAEILDTQRTLFATRRAAQESRASIMRQRIAQLEEQIGGLEAQIDSENRQLALIASEVRDVQELVDRGLERRSRLLSLQRQQADIEGRIGANQAAIAQARQTIGETELQILNLEADRQDEIANELNQVRFERAGIEQDLSRTQDILARTSITAPINGIVVENRFTTVGGVIRPGEPIMDIVPQEEELLIDARVSPNDIDSIQIGMTAQVILSAYSQRRLPRIDGTVRSISADRLVDEVTGQPYFLARVEVNPEELAELEGQISLTAGMPAEVYILTGERTALEYLMEPVIQSFRRAFREA
jgi:HlyD family secretion protein/epimerase transport system membrane fusion protein